MWALRGSSVLAVVASVVLAGCAASTETKQAPSAAGTATPSAEPTRTVELQRIGDITDAFPPGYPANPPRGVNKVDAEQAATAGDLVAYGKPLTAEPQECGGLLKPVKVESGADSAQVNSSHGAQGPFISVAVYDPASTLATIPETGCDRFAFTVAGALPDGTVERLAVPSFDGATSYALKVDYTVTNPNSTQTPLVEYFYIAILDGRTYVSLWARVPPDFAAEPVLPDLLTKAVTEIRER